MLNNRMFRWYTVVDFADTDAGGIVYHARYLEWAERARSSLLRESNLSNQYLWQQGIIFVISRIEINFKQPARLDDKIRLETIGNIKGMTLTANHDIYHEVENILLCRCVVKLICLDRRKQNPTKIPTEIQKLFPGVGV